MVFVLTVNLPRDPTGSDSADYKTLRADQLATTKRATVSSASGMLERVLRNGTAVCFDTKEAAQAAYDHARASP